MSLVEDEVLTHQRLLEIRKQAGGDRWDEVWDGVEVMAPAPNNEHQEVTGDLAAVLVFAVQYARLGKARSGINLSDRVEDWTQNFRVPDIAVFLNGSSATNHETHWTGSPDFVVEVISRYDRSREKLEFFEVVGTREVLLVDRFPWSLELYRMVDGKLVFIGKSTTEDPKFLRSEVMPLGFRLLEGEDRPMIEVSHHDGVQTWIV